MELKENCRDNRIVNRLRLIVMAVLAGIGIVQVILAVAWAVGNGSHMQGFYDSSVYLSNAVNGGSDGWRLAGYACVIKLFMLLKGILKEYYVIGIYLFQVAVSLFCFAEGFRCVAVYLFYKKVSFKKALLFAGYIVTIPIVWQMQFAILPDAICLALTVLVFAQLIKLFGTKEGFRWTALLVIGVSFLLLGVFHRHYLYGALAMTCVGAFILLIRQIKKSYRNRKTLLTALLLMLGIVVFPMITEKINQAVPRNGSYATYSMAADLWKRFVFPDLHENYPHYTERITAILPDYATEVCDEYYEYYMNSIGVMIELAKPEEAESIYFEMARIGFALHRQDMIKSAVKEATGYCFIPFAMEKYMYNNGNSLYGHNYIKMYDCNPKLTAVYMHVGMNGFVVLAVLGCVMFLVEGISYKKLCKKRMLSLGWCALSIGTVTAPMMIFAVAKFDYRIGLFSVFVWAVFAMASIYKAEEEEIEKA